MKYKAETEFRRTSSGTGVIILSLIIAAGIIAGAFCSMNEQYVGCPWLHQFFMPYSSNVKLSHMFVCTAASSLIFLAAVFITGTSAIGQPVGVFLLLYRSFGAGLSAAVVYSAFGIKAVPSVLLLVLPKAAVSLMIAVLAVREAFRSSCGLAVYFSSGNSTENGSLRLYIVRFAVLASISVLVSAGDTALNHFSGGILSLQDIP